jgi:hypothetical protein
MRELVAKIHEPEEPLNQPPTILRTAASGLKALYERKIESAAEVTALLNMWWSLSKHPKRISIIIHQNYYHLITTICQ